jgi:membrane dipeptidase
MIDGHNDLMILIRFVNKNQIHTADFKKSFEKGGHPGHVDIPRMKAGQLGGAFWSAFMPCPANGSDFSDANYAPTVRATLQQLDLYQQLHDSYPKYFTAPDNAKDAITAFKKDKKLISPIGIEGLHQIGNSPAALRLYHKLGVRYATLTWNCHNIYADAAITQNDEGKFGASKPLWGGVSKRGRELIYEMNRIGMLIDLSHVSQNTMMDALVGIDHSDGWKGSVAPPIFSHSSAYAICPHPRNVPDNVLLKVKERNALVMINFSPDFISCKKSNSSDGLPTYVPENNTLAQVVRHIRHIGELIGYDYVGIGTDYDGIDSTPKGLEDVSKFPALVAELLRQGISQEDVIKVIGGNLLRVWTEADAISTMLKLVRKPLDEDVPLRPEYMTLSQNFEEP